MAESVEINKPMRGAENGATYFIVTVVKLGQCGATKDQPVPPVP